MNIKYIISIIGITSILLILSLLAFRFFSPFGSVVKYQFTAGSDTDKITKVNGIETAESFQSSGEGKFNLTEQIIRKNIATFQLKLLSPTVEGIWVRFLFKGNPKEVKLGVRGTQTEKYFYTPLYNQILENLSWEKASEGNTTLFQKEKVYTTVKTFLNDPPKGKTIATYFVDPSSLFMTDDAVNTSTTLDTVLRGPHTFFTKVTHAPFTLSVTKYDGNLYDGEDTLLIEIYKGDQKIAEKTIGDDGITDKSQLKSAPQKTDITLSDITAGIYKVYLRDLSEGADVRISSITVNQPGLVFSAPLFPLDTKPSTITTNSKSVNLQTFHKESLQTIRLDDSYNFPIEKEAVNYNFDLNSPGGGSSNIRDLHTLFIPKNDVVLNGDGLFAFDSASFFDPMAVKTTELTKLTNIDRADYIVAQYQPVSKEGEWMEAQAYINPKDIKIDGDKLYFSLESPELDAKGGIIELNNLEITLTKPSWFGQASTPITSTSGQPQPSFFQKIINWFNGLFTKKKSIANPNTLLPTATPTPEATPTAVTPTLNDDVKRTTSIRVLNGGAEPGTAKKVADLLKEHGFLNVKAADAGVYTYTGVTAQYLEINKTTVSEILPYLKDLLGTSYGTFQEEATTSATATLNLILGSTISTQQ